MADPLATVTQAMINRSRTSPEKMNDFAFDQRVNGPQGYPQFNQFTTFNPKAWDDWLATGPMSQNIEDRRGESDNAESVDDYIKRTLEARAR